MQFARALDHRHRRRELAQVALDALRWVAASYAASLAAVAVYDARLALASRAVLAGAGAAAWIGLAALIYGRRLGRSGGLVGRLEAAFGGHQLATTAWEWVHGRIDSPFGPAVREAADRLAMAAWARLPSLAGAVVRRRRTLVAVLAAASLTLPGALLGLHRTAREVRTGLAPPAAPEGAFPVLSPEQAEFLERLARLLEREAAVTTDPRAERAAREIQSVLSMSGAAAPSGEAFRPGPAVAGPVPGAGQLPGSTGGRSLPGGAPFSSAGTLESRLELLMRLSQLGLIARETADRSAELAALLTDAVPAGEEGEPSTGPNSRATARGPAERPPDETGDGTGGEGEGPAGSPAQGNPPSSASLDEGGEGLPTAPTRRPGSRGGLPGQGAGLDQEAAAGGPTQQDAGTTAGRGASDPEGSGASGGLKGTPTGPGPPGTSPGAVGSEAEATLGRAGERVPLPSNPQLGRGAVLTVLPGPSVRAEPGGTRVPWRADTGMMQPGDEGPPVTTESVPLEYREAVRRYFEALAGEGS